MANRRYSKEMKELQDKYKQIERWRGRIERGEKEGIPKHKDFLPWLKRQEAKIAQLGYYSRAGESLLRIGEAKGII